jgi:hypothetical protein
MHQLHFSTRIRNEGRRSILPRGESGIERNAQTNAILLVLLSSFYLTTDPDSRVTRRKISLAYMDRGELSTTGRKAADISH